MQDVLRRTLTLASCRRHGLDPFVYLRDVLTRLPDHPADRLDDFLPDRWPVLARAAASMAGTPTPEPATRVSPRLAND